MIVTGSTRGLGRAVAGAAADAGASVVINGTNSHAVDTAVAEIESRGGRALGVSGSVADDSFCRRLVDECVTSFGTVDVLINNAGIIRDRSFTKMSVTEFDDVLAVHLRGTFSCSSAAARVMRSAGAGRILNIVSGSGLYGMFGQANYAAAKAGIIGLSRVMDIELFGKGISVNCLAPVADTDMTRGLAADSGVSHDLAFPAADDVAKAAVHIVASDREDLHGQCLSFDGTTLAVWTHPHQIPLGRIPLGQDPSASHDGSWTADDFEHALDTAALEFPHPDRWGMGVSRVE